MDLGKSLIELEFRLDLEDFLETVRVRESRAIRVGRSILMTIGSMLIAALLGLPFLMKDVPGFLAAFLLGVLPLAVLMVLLPWYYKPDRFYRSYYRTFVFQLCKYEISEDGIKATTETSESVHSWNAFGNYTESETQLVLTSGMVQHIFPKRAIEQSKFTELIELVRKKAIRSSGASAS